MIGQMNMFDLTMPMISITNKIRLIETFSGYGSHAMALNEIGADYEHWKISEWEVNANQSYKACHIDDDTDYSSKLNRNEVVRNLLKLGISNDGKKPMTKEEIDRKPEQWQRQTYNEFKQCHNLGSIMNVHGGDFEISDTDKYFYFFTYSYPCTSVSVAGKMEGMKEGSGTASSLIWEVKRVLKEIHENSGELPQILFMENVPQVLSSANIKDFHAWQDFLTGLGYTNHVQVLNAKDYGVAQNRERAFMFSFLGEFNYKFPEPIPLTKTMKDYLDDEVDEKYYINTEKANKLIKQLIDNKTINFENGNNPCKFDKPYVDGKFTSMNGDISFRDIGTETAGTITSRYYKGIGSNGDNAVIVKQVGNIADENNFSNPQTGRVYATDGCAPTLNTCSGGGHEPKIIELGRLNSSQDGIVVDSSGISKTLTAGNNNQPKILDVKCLNTKDENGKQPPQHERVYDTSGIMTSILAEQGGRFNILEETIVAMRGRNPQNPSDRTTGAPTEQRLEPNVQGLCNTITSVQKDNLVLESAILTPKRTDYGKEIRKAYENGVVKESRHNMTELVPRTDGITNTLTTVQKDNLVLENIIIDDTYGYGDTRLYENISPALRSERSGLKTIHIKQATKESRHNMTQLEPRTDGISNTLTTVQKDNMVLERCIDLYNQKQRSDELCGTLTTNSGTQFHCGSMGIVEKVRIKQATKDGYIDCKIGGVADLSFPIETIYRIRKLTERECGRLMCVSDENITRMKKVNSNSQLYKQFGNSIVVLCMVAMFSNLNIQGLPRWDGIKHKYFNPPYRA